MRRRCAQPVESAIRLSLDPSLLLERPPDGGGDGGKPPCELDGAAPLADLVRGGWRVEEALVLLSWSCGPGVFMLVVMCVVLTVLLW